MNWHNIDIDDLPSFRPRIVGLIRHVYRQTGRPLTGGGDSMHYNQTQVSYHPSQKNTSYIKIAEGYDDAPGARMIYSVNAAARTIKQKLNNDAYVPLNTDDFNTLLDEITEYVHARQRRMPSPNIDDLLEAQIEGAYEYMALMAEQGHPEKYYEQGDPEAYPEQEEELEQEAEERDWEEDEGDKWQRVHEERAKRQRQTLHASESAQQNVQLPIKAPAVQQPTQAAAAQQHAEVAAQQAPLQHGQASAQKATASHTSPGQLQPHASAAESEEQTPVTASEAKASSARQPRGKKRQVIDLT